MEPELAALSAPGRADAEIDELDALVRETFDDVLGEAFSAPHRAFHAALIEPAASGWDRRMLGPLWDASERYTRLVFDPVEAPESFAAHRAHVHDELVDAARSRDPERVRGRARAPGEQPRDDARGAEHVRRFAPPLTQIRFGWTDCARPVG